MKNMKSRQLFYFRILTAVIVPLLLLAILELGLRAAGLFEYPSLFNEQKNHYVLNTRVAERYFDPQELSVPGLYPEKIRKNKEDATFRIFALGGSTTAGFPFDCQVPFPQQLRYLLQKKYPHSEFEVINAGISAVNSFTVLDLLPEIIKKEPDLLLIYMGHNEFYGAFGSASTISIGQNGWLIRTYLQMQKFHFFRMIREGLALLRPAPVKMSADETLMEKMIADKSVLYGSEKYRLTLRNFEENIAQIIDLAKSENIPVIFSTLVSNQKDQPPFSGSSAETAQAENPATFLETADSVSAQLNFELANYYLNNNDFIRAKKYYNRAGDFDKIRFRAGEDFNKVIRKICSRNEIPVVEMRQIFEENSPQGIIGAELICDHLHPNPDGYFLMARSFLDKITIPAGQVSADILKPPFINDIDWDIGLWKIFKLRHRWPYEQKTIDFTAYKPYGNPVAADLAYYFVFKDHDWVKAQSKMADHYIRNKKPEMAARHLESVAFYLQSDPQACLNAARLYYQAGNWEKSTEWYLNAFNLNKTDYNTIFNLSLAMWKQKDLKSAIDYMKMLTTSELYNPDRRDKAKYYLAGFYAEADSVQQALQLLDQILNKKPHDKAARVLLKQVLKYQTEQK